MQEIDDSVKWKLTGGYSLDWIYCNEGGISYWFADIKKLLKIDKYYVDS